MKYAVEVQDGTGALSVREYIAADVREAEYMAQKDGFGVLRAKGIEDEPQTRDVDRLASLLLGLFKWAFILIASLVVAFFLSRVMDGALA